MDALSSSSGDLPAPTRPLAGPPLIDSAELTGPRVGHRSNE